MVSMSASIDQASVSAFDGALGLLRDSLGVMSAQAPRRAAIQICKSLRAGTVVAKQRKAIAVSPSEVMPKWITYYKGRKLPRPVRRYNVSLTDRGRTLSRFAYGGSVASARKQLLSTVGTNFYPLYTSASGPKRKGGVRGLAKQSWGWVMHNIFNGAAPAALWIRRKGDLRNPVDAARESYSKILPSRGEAVISNRLDYIVDALRVSLDTAIDKAASAIVRCIATRRIREHNLGMTSAQIREAARMAEQDFLREFRF